MKNGKGGQVGETDEAFFKWNALTDQRICTSAYHISTPTYYHANTLATHQQHINTWAHKKTSKPARKQTNC